METSWATNYGSGLSMITGAYVGVGGEEKWVRMYLLA